MKSTLLALVWMAGVVPVLACGGGSSAKPQGGEGQSCYPNKSCNTGLSCFSNLCVNLNGDASAGTSGAAGVGGSSGAAGSSGAGGSGGASTAGSGGAGSGGAAGATSDGGADASGDASDAAGTDTSATDAGADGGFSVAALPGLALWLDAGKGVTVTNNMTSAWKDQSGNGNDALVGNGGNGASPGYVTGAINGLPAVSFGTNGQALIQVQNGTPTLGFGTGEFLVEVVAKWTEQGGNTILFQTAASQTDFTLLGDPSRHVGALLGNGNTFVASQGATFGDSTFHLIGAHRTGTGAATTLDLRVAGAVDNTATGASYGMDLQSPVAGALGPGDALQVAELVVVKGSTSADDLAHLEAYLKAKYALQ